MPFTSSGGASNHRVDGIILRERDQRLDSLKQTVNRMAHDFNNYLAPILGYATLIREELPPETTASGYAATMEAAAKKTAAYLENLLFAVRPARNYRPQMINLRALLENELAEWQKTLPENAQIGVETALVEARLYGDEEQWRNLFRQLLNNARFALATGGRLEATLKSATFSADDSNKLNIPAGPGFEISFRDNGFGMSPLVLSRAFEPFFTTRGGQIGAGLGLTIVHSVVRLHEGQVLLDSLEDAGAEIRILLPARPEPPPAEPDAPAAALPQKKRAGSKILLVEDDPLVREVMKTCLQKTGREVCTANDGEQGLRAFKRHARDLALVVSDVTMPKMNGFELFLAIRELDPGMQVILVTGDAQWTSEEALAKLGKERPLVIRKPFTLKSFTEVIRKYLDY
jgi:CheY-like chemotaxis protein/nitrogen-specific signal transduction histidine kinase